MTTCPPRRRAPSHGCLWGCLAVLAFILLPVLLAAGYGGWFFYQGYRRDPVLRAVVRTGAPGRHGASGAGREYPCHRHRGQRASYMWGSG